MLFGDGEEKAKENIGTSFGTVSETGSPLAA